jgi:Zn-dependent protease with chaperone function
MKRLLLAVTLGGAALGPPCVAQTTTRYDQPGFNLFTVNQDIELGRQSAVEAERQLNLLNNRGIDNYLNRIVQRLAVQAPGARYPYQVKTVNAAEINAFSLPGGPIYINRGALEAARNEDELAGILAHEMSHIALRHGTNQASKAYLSQSGLSILGGLLGRQSSATRVVSTIGGVGLNAVFLKFSRDDEYQADRTGAQMMARAGYDPNAMASLFQQLRAIQGRDPGKVEQFFSDHPAPADREARIRQLAGSLNTVRGTPVGGYQSMRTTLSRLPGIGSGQVITQNPVPPYETPTTPQVTLQIQPPSTRFESFEQPNGFFTVAYPDNWQAFPSGLAVSLAPQGGIVTAADGRQILLYGVIVNHYAPFEGDSARWLGSLQHSYAPFEDRTRPRRTLEDATDDLIRQIERSNTYLVAQDNSARSEMIDGQQGYEVQLAGRSPVTGEEERVSVHTRGLSDGHVVYMLTVVPGSDYSSTQRIFARMLRSLAVNDEAAHRSNRISRNPPSQRQQ